MDTAGFLVHARLELDVLETWVADGWVAPRSGREAERFSEIDLARVQLIRELKHDLGINDEGVAVILDLVDQIHGLRSALHGLCSAVNAQPSAVRHQILSEVRDVTSGRAEGEGQAGASSASEPGRAPGV